jgi:rhodanese-related sulfurtransferase
VSTIHKLKPVDARQSFLRDPESLLIDVRDPVEFAFVGHPIGAVNIPWKVAPEWQIDPRFVERVRKAANHPDRPLFLICRSGQRSLDAANALAAAGFLNLTNIEDGFEGPLDASKQRGTLGGWRHSGLPWEQS